MVTPDGSSTMEATSAFSRGMPATFASVRRRLVVAAGALTISAVVRPAMTNCAATIAGGMGTFELEGVGVGVVEREAPTEGVVVGVGVGVRVAEEELEEDLEGFAERVVVCEAEIVAEAQREGEALAQPEELTEMDAPPGGEAEGGDEALLDGVVETEEHEVRETLVLPVELNVPLGLG